MATGLGEGKLRQRRTSRLLAHSAAGLLALLAPAGLDATALTRAADGAAVPAEMADSTLASDQLVVALSAGEQIRLADQALTAETNGRALVALSSEFLTVAVTAGRLRLGEGPAAGPGQALVLALDGARIQRLGFDPRPLAASLTPGARALLGADVAGLVRARRRAAFWGSWEPFRVNARAPGPAALEQARMAYLGAPAIVAQRRQSAQVADAETRISRAAASFLSAWRERDAAALAALLDPAPFLARAGGSDLGERRARAATALLADPSLGALAGAQPGAVDARTGTAELTAADRRWRLHLVPRDRALFVAALEPLT